MKTPTYGKLTLQDNRWILSDIPPHVAIRLKSVFPRVPKHQTGVFDLPATSEFSADLSWFMSRYPLQISDSDRRALEGGKELFELDRAESEAILLPDWQPTSRHGFRPGRDAYHYQKQASELLLRKKALLLGDDMGLGKEQPLTSKLLTPTGWARMGDAYVGMPIIGKDGRTHHVTGVFPQGVKPAYRLTFTDGSQAECGLDHLWTVRDHNRRMRGHGWTVKPLNELIERGIRYKSGATKWEIPIVDTVEFEQKDDLPIDPYILGVLIGDGYLTGSSLTFSAPASKEPVLERVSSIVGDDRISGPHGSAGSEQWNILSDVVGRHAMMRYLKRAGLCVKSPERFIPNEYMFASAKSRIELLRGLMDTDGSSSRNRIVFSTCSRRLAYDVMSLVRSLGGASNVREYDREDEGKRTEWQVNVRIHFNPFYLPYKANGWKNCEGIGRARRYIQSIEYIGDVEQQCIRVSAKDSLYVTDDYVVTHNTIAALHALAGSRFLPAAIVVQSHLPTQWVEEYIKPFTYMTAHIVEGTKPYNLPPANLYIFKYSNIHGWVDIAATGFFKAVVYDEIQELRNGTDTAKGKAAKVFSDNAELRAGLSGTPVFNYGSEIFSILKFLNPEILGDWGDFVREWCRMGPGGKWVVTEPDALGSYLRESQVFLRRLRQGRPINKIPVEVDYDEDIAQSAEDLARMLAIKVTTGSFAEAGVAARELDAFARLQTGLAKAKSVAALVRMHLEKGIPVLLGGWHRDVYSTWIEELKDFKPMLYTGSESITQKNRTKEAFIKGDTDLMIISLRSGAGLDGLQKRCSTVILGELDWSPQVAEQLFARVDRPGQPADEITVYIPYVNYGSDPTIMAINAVKKDQARGINDPGIEAPAVYSDESRFKMLAKQFLKEEP